MPEGLTDQAPGLSLPASSPACSSAPTPSLPAEPLCLTPQAPRLPLRRRPLVLALLVLAAGAALGAAAFAAEQRFFVWRPEVTLVANGWRVERGTGGTPVAPAIAGDRLAWGQGLFTCTLDLRSGESKVVGFASSHLSIWPPSISARHVAWMETPRDDRRHGHVWVYDTASGRRVSYRTAPHGATAAVGDRTVVWFERDRENDRVVAVDLASGKRTVLASGEGVGAPVLASGSWAGWLRGATAELVDVESDATVRVPLATGAGGMTVGDIQLAGHHLVWTQGEGAKTRVLDCDIATGTTVTVAQGDVRHPATDGETLVWATSSASGAGATVVAAGLAGGEQTIVMRLPVWPESLAVGGTWVAWTAGQGQAAYLQTRELPR